MTEASGPRPARPAPLAFAEGLDRAIGGFCRFVLVATGTTLTAVMTANVFARYVLAGGGFRFAQELPTLLFPWFILAGIVLAAQGGAHMAVDWLYGKLEDRGKAGLFIVAQASAAASMLVLAWQAFVVGGIAGFERSPILGLPNSIGYYALAIGAVLVALVTATSMLRVALGGFSARPQSNVEELQL